MLYSKGNDLQERIVEVTGGSRITIKSLREKLRGSRNISLRAVYKAVNKLINAGVLLKVGKQVMIDREWAEHVADMLGSPPTSLLSNGERAIYTFISVEHLDAFWKTVVLPLEDQTSVREIFFYNPHNFWAYLASS
ncbi:hypothetical protein HY415_02095 [Candidatus Kaiserbacteria bacterium]|nr:hypothetical protein [Candidatus Kaiserbacteria bacterium]